MIDFQKTPEEIITALFAQANGITLSPLDLVFGVPQTISSPGARRNTRLSITGRPERGVIGTVEVQYNRAHINTIPGVRSRNFNASSITQQSQLVAAINSAYGINITAGDYLLAELPAAGVPAQLVMHPSSLVFFGQLDFQLTGPAEDLTHLLFRDTFTGTAGTDLLSHQPETGGPWSYTQMVSSGFTLDGAGALVPLQAAAGDFGGYLNTPALATDQAGFALTLDFEITDLITQGQYLELRLYEDVPGDRQSLFRISYNLDSGAPYGSFSCNETLFPAVSTQFNDSVNLLRPFTAMGLGKHTFRVEVVGDAYTAFIDGAQVAQISTHGYVPTNPVAQLNYYAIAGATPWKFDYFKVQGYTPVGYVAPLPVAPIFSGTFTKTEAFAQSFMVYEAAAGEAGVKFYINDVDTPYTYGSNTAGSFVVLNANVNAGDRLRVTARDRTKVAQIHFEAYDVLSDAGGLPANYFAEMLNLGTFSIHGCHQAGSLPELTGLTQLTDLEAYASNLSGPVPSLASLASLAYLDLNTNQLSGAVPDLSATSLAQAWLQNNQFTDFAGGVPQLLKKLSLANNSLTQAAVDAILAALVAAANPDATGNLVDLTGGTNAAPSAAGAASAATLRAGGWTVSTN